MMETIRQSPYYLLGGDGKQVGKTGSQVMDSQ